MEDQPFWQVLRIAPDHPARPQWRQAEFVAGGADGFDPGNTEIPQHFRCTERGQECTAGAIDVNINAQAGAFFQIIEGV